MASLNKVQIIGNLGRDPETRYMPSGDAMTTLAIATSETWKDKNTGEKKDAVEWHRVTAFGKLAEIMGQYLKKGSKVYIEGSLRSRKYTDKDGVEKYATDIRADNMIMLDGKQDGQSQAPSAPAPRQAAPAQQQRTAPDFSDMDENIPF